MKVFFGGGLSLGKCVELLLVFFHSFVSLLPTDNNKQKGGRGVNKVVGLHPLGQPLA